MKKYLQKHCVYNILLKIIAFTLLLPRIAHPELPPPGLIQTVQISDQENSFFPIPFIPSSSNPETEFTDLVTSSGLSLFQWDASGQQWRTKSYLTESGWQGDEILLKKAEAFLAKSHAPGDWKLSLTGHLSAEPLTQHIAPGLNMIAAPMPMLSDLTAWDWDLKGTASTIEANADKLFSSDNDLMSWLRLSGINRFWESTMLSGEQPFLQPGYTYWYLSQASQEFLAEGIPPQAFDAAALPAVRNVAYNAEDETVVLTIETDGSQDSQVNIYYQDATFPQGVDSAGEWTLLTQESPVYPDSIFQIEDAGSENRPHPQSVSMRLYQVVNADQDVIANPSLASQQLETSDDAPVIQNLALTENTSSPSTFSDAPSESQAATESNPPPMAMSMVSFTITPTPLLETCGIATDYPNANATVEVEYKESASGIWKEAYGLIWDPREDLFAGSIVNLEEETDYDVRVSFYVNGVLDAQEETSFSTWTKTENLPIAVEHQIANIYDPTVSKQLKITSGGSASGWVKIVGDGSTVIDAEYLFDNAIEITEFKSYIILENLIIRGGRKNGIRGFGSRHIRIINCDIAGWGRQPEATQRSDGLWYEVGTNDVINYDSAIALNRSGSILVERCFVHDPRSTANSWQDGGGGTHPSGPNAFFAYGNHVNSIHSGRIVVRYNDFIGSDAKRWNDVIEGQNNGSSAGAFARDSDIYGNYLAFGNDDGAELDGGQSNVKFFQNKIEGTVCGVSIAPPWKGPSYIYKNLFVNMVGIRGKYNATIKAGDNGKLTTGELPAFIAFNNTSYTKSVGIGGTGKKYRAITRNNIFQTFTDWSGGRYGINDAHQDPLSDYDYDIIANTARTSGGVIIAAPGQEANGFFIQQTVFEDPEAANFQLTPGSVGVDDGQIIPNFSDGYIGSAPDIGAFEVGADTMLPHRPIPQRASRQKVNLEYNPGGDASSETVTIINPAASIGYKILRTDGHDWIQVTPATGTIPASGSLALSVSIDTSIAAQRTPKSYNTNAVDGLVRGAFVIKFENGFSIPVSVYGDENLDYVNPDDPSPEGILVFNPSEFSDYSNQTGSGNMSLEASNTAIHLTGNYWRKYAYAYNVTAKTMLEVTLDASDLGELTCIGFDSDNDYGTSVTNVQLGGAHTHSSFPRVDNQYSAGSGPVTYLIPIGTFFTGNMSYLTFIGDDDGNASADVTFSNIRIYEAEEVMVFDPSNFSDYTNQSGVGGMTLESSNTAIHLTGNTWRKYAFPYTVTANTMIEVTVNATDVGELTCIGFDSDNDYNTSATNIKFAGSQSHAHFKPVGNTYVAGSGPVTYVIPVGTFFTGNMSYLTFVGDDDGGENIDVIFSDIRIYEAESVMEFDASNFSDYSNQSGVGGMTLESSNTAIHLTGNTWRKYAFTYNVTANTIIEVTVNATDVGELTCIGFDSDDDYNDDATHVKFAGSQSHAHFKPLSNIYVAGSGPVAYTIPIGTYFTGNMSYLTFVGDDDAGEDIDIIFSDIRIYEGP